MEICPECGYENPVGALICESCGALLFIRKGTENATHRIEEDPTQAPDATKAQPKPSTTKDGEPASSQSPAKPPAQAPSPQKQQPVRIPAPAKRGTKTFRTGTRLILHYGEGGDDAHQVVVVDDEITIGRVDEHTSFLPDVNLSRMAAWERGVSRLHAAIRRTGSNLYLIDLASTNGTYLNGSRVPPREPQLIRDGDVIRLGLFEMRISFAPADV